MDSLYGAGGRVLGRILDQQVIDADGQAVGRISTAGGGRVFDADDWMVGEVLGNGVVEDDDANEIGYVRGRSVYNRLGALVGTVEAATDTAWITGVSDAHKAGAALLLLLAARTD